VEVGVGVGGGVIVPVMDDVVDCESELVSSIVALVVIDGVSDDFDTWCDDVGEVLHVMDNDDESADDKVTLFVGVGGGVTVVVAVEAVTDDELASLETESVTDKADDTLEEGVCVRLGEECDEGLDDRVSVRLNEKCDEGLDDRVWVRLNDDGALVLPVSVLLFVWLDTARVPLQRITSATTTKWIHDAIRMTHSRLTLYNIP
jgi:hypothetical protein